MVSTQRPSEVSNTVISKCSSLIVHKITNSKDLEFIRNTIEYDDKNQIDLLTSPKHQQALVLVEAFAFSSLTKITDANPLPLSETANIFTVDKIAAPSQALQAIEYTALPLVSRRVRLSHHCS
jgi:hypothetical protein